MSLSGVSQSKAKAAEIKICILFSALHDGCSDSTEEIVCTTTGSKWHFSRSTLVPRFSSGSHQKIQDKVPKHFKFINYTLVNKKL